MRRPRTVSFFPAARHELQDAVSYYNDQCAGLGFEFAAEVRNTIARILRFPASWTKLSPSTHRCLTHRFPYAVIYFFTSDELFIVAIMHLKRTPDSWRNNLT